VVDLAAVTFLDSTGIGVLVRARNRAVTSGAALTVVNFHRPVRRVFDDTGVLPA
jgi:anti-sigma B factor antagonist